MTKWEEERKHRDLADSEEGPGCAMPCPFCPGASSFFTLSSARSHLPLAGLPGLFTVPD